MAREKDAEQALEKYGNMLMKFPNVMGVGIGKKNVRGRDAGNLCVKVYVSKKLPIEELHANEIVPRQLTIVKKDAGIERKVSIDTDVEEIGEIKLE